ncbi:MAG TPA: hypothetical protein VMA77_25655 [Solirubrobacteraceae bacterium]|nr:hypothetical protein [Solirubrobacteraceae bacterium]
MNASRRSLSSSHVRDAVDFDSFPSPASSTKDSTSRIDKPRTNAPITNAFNGSVRNSFGVRGNSLDANVSAAWRTCGISIASSPSAVCILRARNPLRSPPSSPLSS